MFQSDGTNFNIMILEELSDIGFLELYRIVSNIDLMFSPGNKKVWIKKLTTAISRVRKNWSLYHYNLKELRHHLRRTMKIRL